MNTLATGNMTGGIALDATHVYYVGRPNSPASEQIMRVPRSGGEPEIFGYLPFEAFGAIARTANAVWALGAPSATGEGMLQKLELDWNEARTALRDVYVFTIDGAVRRRPAPGGGAGDP